VLAAGCGDEEGGGAQASIKAVTSLEVFADLVRNVGGERVEVVALYPSGSDPHTYELPPARVVDVAEADIIFINGLELEHSLEGVIENNASGPVVELTEGLPVLEGDSAVGEEEEGEEHADEEGDEHEEGNPHMWLDARLAARYVERIRDALADLDPAGRGEYEANAQAYLEELGDLDREIEAAIELIPPERRKLVTFHDAYPYLAARYGLEVVGVVVPSPGQEPSAQDVARLVETLRSAGVPAVFKEPQFNAAILEQVAGDAGVRVLDLLSDAYVDGVDSYLDLMHFNLRQLEEGLGAR
jgi:ABC-type Zn uptake system ZnuABC Zn-binding protein ZnuA